MKLTRIYLMIATLALPVFPTSLALLTLPAPLHAESEDITNRVFDHENYSNDENKTFYVGTHRTWSTGGAEFTQSYENGTLVFGNTTTSPGSNEFWFGGAGLQGGLIGYITANFNAKDIYLTGTIGAGNSWHDGGGATLNFKASNSLVLDSLTLKLEDAGTQNSHFSLEGSSLSLKNSTLNAHTDGFTLSLKSTTDAIALENTKAYFGGNISVDSAKDFTGDSQSVLNSTNGVIDIKAKENIDFKGTMDFSSGGLTWDGYVNLSAGQNLTLGTINTTLHYGSAQFIASAGKDLSIDKLNLKYNLITAASDSTAKITGENINIKEAGITIDSGGSTKTASLDFAAQKNLNIDKLGLHFVMGIAAVQPSASFSGENITIKEGEITMDPGAAINAAAHVKFNASGDINLGATKLHAQHGTSGNGSSFTFTGKNLTHTGELILGRAGTSTDDEFLDSGIWGAKMDFSGVSGKVSVGDIKARKGNIITNGDFYAKSITARTTTGNPVVDIHTQEKSKLQIDKITIDGGGGSGHNTALQFNEDGFKAGSSLTTKDIVVNTKGGLYASGIATTTADNITLGSGSVASFHHLALTPGGQITMDANSAQLRLENQIVNGKSEAGVLTLGVSMKDYESNINGYGKPILAITNAGDRFQNLNIQAGQTKRLIDAGEIKYDFVDSTGKETTIHCDGSQPEKCKQIEDLIGIYAGEKPADNGDYTQGRIDLSAMGLQYEKVLTYNYIGLKISSNNANNPYDIGDIRYYLYEKCGAECVDKIGSISNTFDKVQVDQTQTGSGADGKAQQIYVYQYHIYDDKGNIKSTEKVFCDSKDAAACASAHGLDSSLQLTQAEVTHTESDVFDWFNFLAITNHGITWTGANILLYGEDFFLQSAQQLNNTLDQLSSVDRKSSASASTRLAADIARANRLVKLSNRTIDTDNRAFARLVAQSAHYADSGAIASDIDQAARKINPAFLYKFSNRHEFMNNIWATAIGSASFVKNGYGTLYGINTGYDRFIPMGEDSGLIIGAQVSYGYGTYTADLLKNHSHNVNSGIYTRTFIQNHEIDFNANYTIGLNSEDIYTRQNIWLSALDQFYSYNTHTAMLHANYGYVFGTNNKSLVFKPMGGLSYYHISVGELNGGSKHITSADPNAGFKPDSTNAAIQSPHTSRDLLALNLALEMRQYFSSASYYFINVGAQKDLYISKGTIENVRFAGDNSLSYRASDGLNTHVLATAGGEVLFGKQMFVNFALGGKAGLSYKDLNLTANLGVRYVF